MGYSFGPTALLCCFASKLRLGDFPDFPVSDVDQLTKWQRARYLWPAQWISSECRVSTRKDSTPTDKLINHCSSFNRLCRAVLWFHKFVNWRRDKNVPVTDIDADQMHDAKMYLIRYVQWTVYRVEYDLLSTGKDLPKKDKLYHLEPSLDDNGIVL